MARPFILITYPYPIGQKAAGGSRTTKEVALHLAKQGADVMIMPVSTNPLSRRYPRKPVNPAELGTEHDAELNAGGVEVIRPDQDPWLYQLDGRPVKREVKKVLKQRKVDMVLGHFHEAAFLPKLCRKHGVKFGFLATWQTYAGLAWRPSRLIGWVRKWFDHITIIKPHRLADVQFAISEFTQRELVDVLGVEASRIRICPLGTEPTFLELPRKEPKEIVDLIFFGRLTPSKGFRDAIEALAKVKARGVTNWRYRMFGAGRPEWARESAEKHGVADQVEINDPIDTETLGRELSRAQLAILPSYAESFGHSMVEAQAAGIPVCGYAAGSVPEVVQDGNTGWLAPLQDIDGLADRIEAALRDPAGTYQAGLRARERVRQTYTWERTAEIIMAELD